MKEDHPLSGKVSHFPKQSAMLETEYSGGGVASPEPVTVRQWQCKSESFHRTVPPASRCFSCSFPFFGMTVEAGLSFYRKGLGSIVPEGEVSGLLFPCDTPVPLFHST
jgi:hypothetical protein